MYLLIFFEHSYFSSPKKKTSIVETLSVNFETLISSLILKNLRNLSCILSSITYLIIINIYYTDMI